MHNVHICFAVNDTDIDCPVDDEEVCGNDGKTYSSICRMLIESDDVYAIYDGPCNRTECEEVPVSNCQLHKCYESPNFIYTYAQM